MNKKIAGNCSVYCEGLCKITNEKISLYKKRKELKKMNIAIVDDSREDREKLRGILEKYADAGGEKFNIMSAQQTIPTGLIDLLIYF